MVTGQGTHKGNEGSAIEPSDSLVHKLVCSYVFNGLCRLLWVVNLVSGSSAKAEGNQKNKSTGSNVCARCK